MSASKLDAWYAGATDYKPHVATIKRYLIKKLGPCCVLCGWSEVNPWSGQVALVLDHIDGSHDNVMASNFRLLCPNCHALTPTFAGLNVKSVKASHGPCRQVRDPYDVPEYDDPLSL